MRLTVAAGKNMKRTKHWTSPHKCIFQKSLQATCTLQTKAFETCFIIFQTILQLSSRVASAVRGDPSKAWVGPRQCDNYNTNASNSHDHHNHDHSHIHNSAQPWPQPPQPRPQRTTRIIQSFLGVAPATPGKSTWA